MAFGTELKDAFRPINSWVQNGISWLDDIQSFYRERALIEREYASKLSALAKDHERKKRKTAAAVSVGDVPALTSGTSENSSLQTWAAIISATEQTAKEHNKLGLEYAEDVADTIKGIANRFEDFRKHHTKLAAKMMSERDNAYNDVKRTKGQYDYNCKECNALKTKAEKHLDASNVKAERGYKSQLVELNNSKNAYLLSLNVANRHKEHFYHETLPDLLNSMQDLSETRTAKLNAIWTRSCEMELKCLNASIGHSSGVLALIPRNVPTLDSMMFIQHNKTDWQEPADFYFEASHVWRDTPDMATDEAARIFLLNLLGKGKAGLEQMKQEVDKKRREIENFQRTKESVKIDESRAAQDAEVTKNLLNAWDDLVASDSKRITLETEVESILSAVGDLTRDARSHKFKATSFKIPTSCDLCGEKIIGFGSKGFHCKDCGYSCHSKCEMKVPAACPGVLDKAQKKALKTEKAASPMSPLTPTISMTPSFDREPPSPALPEMNAGNSLSRSNTMTSLSSTLVPSRNPSQLTRAESKRSVQTFEEDNPVMGRAPVKSPGLSAVVGQARRVMAPPPSQYVKPSPAELHGESANLKPKGKMLYAYTARDSGEISIPEGTEFTIVEGDDEGWTKISYGGDEGVVPTSYMEVLPQSSTLASPAFQPGHSYSSSNASISTMGTASGKKKGPAVAPKRGAKKVQYVEAVYDYEARTDQEFSMIEGDKFVLINRDTGDGWTDVELNGVTKSVPTSYIQEM